MLPWTRLLVVPVERYYSTIITVPRNQISYYLYSSNNPGRKRTNSKSLVLNTFHWITIIAKEWLYDVGDKKCWWKVVTGNDIGDASGHLNSQDPLHPFSLALGTIIQ